MAKFCPITGGRVLYLECLECEDRVCERPLVTLLPKKEKYGLNIKEETKADSEAVQEPPSTNDAKAASHSCCETCCHKCGEHQTTMFGKTFQAVQCSIFHNRVFTSEMVKAKGCKFHNRDISQEKICLNCEHYLGGGDWGLACKANYYKLPGPTSEACGEYIRRGDCIEEI